MCLRPHGQGTSKVRGPPEVHPATLQLHGDHVEETKPFTDDDFYVNGHASAWAQLTAADKCLANARLVLFMSSKSGRTPPQLIVVCSKENGLTKLGTQKVRTRPW